MKIIHSSVIYENPLPQLRSRHSFFPFACQCSDGSILALHAIGQAFESVDSTTCCSRSIDGGKTWSEPKPILDKSAWDVPLSDYLKPTLLPDGRLCAFGYGYPRPNPEFPLGNPETGGLLDDEILLTFSHDNGQTWEKPQVIPCAWGRHAEASAPITVLQDGSWITPITGFPDWAGNATGRMCGRALKSNDGGRSWNDDAVCMQFPGDATTCYEQRMCQLDSGTVVCIGWNEDTISGQRLCNHFTLSHDNGKTWTQPRSTGILGQASSLCAIGDEKLLALHAVRRDTERPGIYACIVDLSEGNWNIEETAVVWEPVLPLTKDTRMAEIFSFLKFGQPGAIRLSDGDILMTHWCAQEGQYKTVATRIRL